MSNLMTIEQASDASGIPVIILKSMVQAGRVDAFSFDGLLIVVDLDQVELVKAESMAKPLRGAALQTALGAVSETPRVAQTMEQQGAPEPPKALPRSRHRTKDSKADKLWQLLATRWPETQEWLAIEEVSQLIPFHPGKDRSDPEVHAIAGNRSTYDFCVLTLLSTHRRNYVVHEDLDTETSINFEVVKARRNNGYWRRLSRYKVRRQTPTDRPGPSSSPR